MEKICTFQNCFNRLHSRGLCRGHYSQMWNGKELKELGPRGRKSLWNGITCKITNCKRNAIAIGLCSRCYSRIRELNVTIEKLNTLSDVCEICGTEDSRAHLDHNHSTGEIRGVLCHQCNIALGMIKENKTIAENLIKYIEKYSE